MRPFVYDLTYVAARLGASTPTGIERVDQAFARHFFLQDGRPAHGLHYGLARPHLLSNQQAKSLVGRSAQAWSADPDGGADPVHQAVLDWLAAPAQPFAIRASVAVSTTPDRPGLLERTAWRVAGRLNGQVPKNALYLNVAQYAFEYPWFFRWLEQRPDTHCVFFIHDLLPLDYPEYFRDGYKALFERRVETMARFAHAAIVSSAVVADRLASEMKRRGRGDFPIHADALPPPLSASPALEAQPAPSRPYFVMTGTIEPRKNHLLVLNAWRDLATSGAEVPRLVLVGPRGWEHEQVADMLDRSERLRPHVAEVSGLSGAGLTHLVRHARAVLMPSFDEGYGLPAAEALSLGTPVIASDRPIFQEVTQGRALLLDPTDGPAWRSAIQIFTSGETSDRAYWQELAGRYVPPTWPTYFGRIEAFLNDL